MAIKSYKAESLCKTLILSEWGASHFQVVNMDQAQLDITRVSDEDTSPNQEEANIEACFKAVEQRQDPLHPSKVFDGFGDYLAIDIIGKGGTGIVYKAIDKKNQKVIALKIFPNLEELGESFLSRFRREIKLLEKLNHQSIIKLYDTGTFEKEEETFHYIALEYFQGVSLKDHVRSLSLIHKAPTPMHWHKVFRVLLQISHALHYMHSQGVLHRDIKPDNIMYDDMKGISKIIDLGLGKCIVEEEQRQTLFTTQPNSALGTPHYMSIEQWYDTKDVDERADIYSLGATAYFLLSARIPYGEHIELRTLYRAVLKRELTPITELCKNKVPAPFLAIIQKMMAFEAANRYSSCQGICEDLNKYVNQYPQDFKSI
jgi:serine/threonine protein kinase